MRQMTEQNMIDAFGGESMGDRVDDLQRVGRGSSGVSVGKGERRP